MRGSTMAMVVGSGALVVSFGCESSTNDGSVAIGAGGVAAEANVPDHTNLESLERIVDEAGVVDCEARSALAVADAAEWWSYRRGPTSAAFHDGPAVISTRVPDGPADGRFCYGGCSGEPIDWTGYSGQALYLAPDAAPGMDRTRFIWSRHEGHGGEKYWHEYLLRPLNQQEESDGDSWYVASPDPAFAQDGWPIGGLPTAISRGKVTWGNHAIVTFSSGLVGAVGSGNSGDEYPTLQLPEGRFPTGVAVTPNNELALITLWNVETCTGELAVVALRSRNNPWSFPTKGFFNGIELLGLVELEMQVPTSVAATVDLAQYAWLPDADLSKERELWVEGDAEHQLAQNGYAIVASRDEGLVQIVDLKPTLSWLRDAYLGSNEDFESTQQEDWPPTFEVGADELPVVVSDFELERPTVVVAGFGVGDRAYLGADQLFRDRAYVGTLNGSLVELDVSSLMGSATGEPSEVDRHELCHNPTDVFYGRGAASRDLMVFACRGDRAVLLIGPDGKVQARLEDERLIDPSAVAMGESRGASVLIVGDGNRVLNYLNGPIQSWGDELFGPIPDGEQFELVGALGFAGPVVAVSAAEVP